MLVMHSLGNFPLHETAERASGALLELRSLRKGRPRHPAANLFDLAKGEWILRVPVSGRHPP